MKRFLEILAYIVSHASESVIDMMTEAFGLVYDDAYSAGREYEASQTVQPAPVYGLPLEHVQSILIHLRNRRKIQAIKELRAHSGLGLREAKDWIDGWTCFIKGYDFYGKWNGSER